MKKEMSIAQFVKLVMRRLEGIDKQIENINDDLIELGEVDELKERIAHLEDVANSMHKRGMS